ncbi:Formate/nitrite transporter [Aureobasidium pullulans]|uniref:Formate/nitrite transporter n=1 Tax=Aureobasidium pullulans TaxID=5580 RepID=A0A4S9TVI7_AURPU|nr:Formate/nitrite transporter [Aureobasidium pullulans]THX22655.1 Formate/nitrite transporter [Aureobasidium pullulans]THX33491.1 Formate/nitrite transporter [Aureobasidium pullulans]THX86113.1 Formate/nitrite transporter [Aureobasidium pullulans]THZ12612.1 Formate/nitrite transporter [Aureobasidium pullulans]
MSTGALTPRKAAEKTLETGVHHLEEDLQLTFLKNVYGALLVSAGGLLSLTITTGSPGLSESNPGLPRILQGLTFPIGLVLVYLVGAELYTGYPMWFVMTALERKGKPLQYIRSAIASWTGNLLGSLLFAGLFTHLTDILSEEPFRSGTISMISEDIIESQWHIIFLRSILCGWLVTFSMMLGSQNQDGISKALALHLPFFISTAAKCPHTVEYMYLGSTAMFLGSPMSVAMFIWKCLIPVTLGNTIGGGIFTGAYSWWVHLYCDDKGVKHGDANGNGWGSVRLDDDE